MEVEIVMNALTRNICVTALGIALFVVLSLCLQVPVFENYYLCLGYVVLAIYCYSFGVSKSIFVGFLGVILYCLLTSGLRGMPGWSLGNIVIAVATSLACTVTSKLKSKTIRHILIAVIMVLSTAVGILGVKSVVECLLYSQPFLLRVAKNIYAFAADSLVLVISIPICYYLNPTIKRQFPEMSINK